MSLPTAEIVGLGAVAAVGGFMAALSLRPSGPTDVEMVESRLRTYAAATQGQGQVLSLEEIELQVPFVERVIRPLIARLARLTARATPEQARLELQKKLNLAGRPYGLEATEFTVVRYALTVLLFLVGVALSARFGNPTMTVLVIAGFAATGFFLPPLWLRQLVNQRRNEIEYTLPSAIDLLSVSVEAGLSFESALATVAEKLEGPLGAEFQQALQEIRLGRPRLEALDDLGRRVGVEEVHNLVQAIIQSAQLGTPISQILTLQADEIRRRRRQHAQEMGARAPLKMLFPMVACIFPTIWVMLLGPALLLIMAQCGGIQR
ncbi:MAG TPA: type II secretion system F family protein [Candidatus Dormibacteraeota bacterium]